MFHWVLLSANLWHIAEQRSTDERGLRTCCGLEVDSADIRQEGDGDAYYVFPRCPACLRAQGKIPHA